MSEIKDLEPLEGAATERELLSIDLPAAEAGAAAAESVDQAIDHAAEAAQLAREVDELRQRALRTLADFDNYRKRAERERDDLRRLVLADTLRELLPVVDNLERAVAAEGDREVLQRGVEMTLKQLGETLKRLGLLEIPALGQPFDPHRHEAISRREEVGVEEPTVIAQFQRGYLLGERVLRPAVVVVAVPVEEDSAEPAPPSDEQPR